MAGTSWDKLGQMDAAFELVAPALRRVARSEGARLHEFFRDDPVWRLDFAGRNRGDGAVDVAWEEDRPEEYAVSVLWWEGERLQRQELGSFSRERSLGDLEAMLPAPPMRAPLRLGWKASAEQFGPRPLLDFAVLAEECGFDSVMVSDHFSPWRHTDGHAPFSLAWLAAAGERTRRLTLGTSVLTPTFRYHPSIVAH